MSGNLRNNGVNSKEIPLSTVIAKTETIVTVKANKTVLQTDLINSKSFSKFPNIKKANPVNFLSLSEFCEYLNNYVGKQKKSDNEFILKGVYDGKYYNGENCQNPTGFLFYDIDIKTTEAGDKKNENTHLITYDKNGEKIPNENNKLIFEALKKVSVLIWRSNSQTGIAGILFVPQLAEVIHAQKSLHLKIGKEITKYLADYLETETGVKRIEFDNAQSKFRQPRYLATQSEVRELNFNPFEFSYTTKEIQLVTPDNVPEFKRSYHTNGKTNKTFIGSIFDQYNQKNNIETVAFNCGFSRVPESLDRLKYQFSESDTSGTINTDENVYFNYSDTVQKYLDTAGANGLSVVSPALMECAFNYSGNWTEFAKALFKAGYKNEIPTGETIDKIKKEFAEETEITPKVIYHYCSQMRHAPESAKKEFKKEFATIETRKYFNEYLQLSDNRIKYDKTINIINYVSECINEIVNIESDKLLIYSETGNGKTRAITNELTKYGKILLLEPLTAIVKQLENETKGAFLTGENYSTESFKILDNSLTVATYEQGAKILNEGFSFDYIIIDEVHQLLTANSFRYESIRDLTDLLEFNKPNQKLIGLTGTPNEIFRKLGFDFVKIHKKKQKPVNIEVRFCNLKPRNIILNHLDTITGKTIIRLNEINTLKILKNDLIKSGKFFENEILIFYSADEVKKGNDFRDLAKKQSFNDNIKIILTTSLIDEGVSINQKGFTDVIYIETKYNPRPESVKQFFARFRNDDTNRRNYLYLRKRINQTEYFFNQNREFDQLYKILIDTDYKETSSVYSLTSNDLFYYEPSRINPFYLAYTVTDNYFGLMNAENFIEYLQTNYNLNLTINKDFELIGGFETDTPTKKQIKRATARIWKESRKTALFTVIRNHTLDAKIKASINPTPETLPDADRLFIIEFIKVFEKLLKWYNELISFDIEPDTIIINDENEIISDKNYNDFVMLHKFFLAFNNPKNKTDRANKNNFKSFCSELVKKSEWTTGQVKKLLKKNHLLNKRIHNIKNVLVILNCFGIHAKQDTKTKIIQIEKHRE